jgi:hypothetical protein
LIFQQILIDKLFVKVISSRDGKNGGEMMVRVSPAQVEKSIKGIRFPASKQDLVQQAESNNANEDVLNILENVPDKQFNSPVDISKAIGKMK